MAKTKRARAENSPPPEPDSKLQKIGVEGELDTGDDGGNTGSTDSIEEGNTGSTDSIEDVHDNVAGYVLIHICYASAISNTDLQT